MTIIQNERFDYLKQLIDRDLSTYAGPILEKLLKRYSDYNVVYEGLSPEDIESKIN
ncbi:MAG: hypothetical protein GY756_09070 [bacterium]|nr:hypothetical protein [bacterium]